MANAENSPVVAPVNSLYGFYGGTQPVPQVPDIEPDAGEATPAQSPQRRWGGNFGVSGQTFGGETGNAWLSTVYGGLNGGMGYSGGMGGTWSGYPIDVLAGGGLYGWGSGGFRQPRRGFYSTYRLMNLHPTINSVKTLIFKPILCSNWTIKKRHDDVPDKWMKEVRDQLLPQRWEIMQSAVDYVTFGWQPFEKIWAVEDGKFILKRLKPLLQDLTWIETDYFGNYAGVRNMGRQDLLLPDKSLVLTYDGKAGNLYGLSRHENAYEAWTDWLQVRLKRMQLLAKISGILPILKFKPGQTPIMNSDGSQGTPLDNAEIARQILATLGMGNGVALPCVEYEDSELAQNPALAKTTPWELDFYKAGDYSTAIDGYISCFEYEDKLLFRAWGKPERTGLETQHASRADSKTHTESSDVDSESIDDDIAFQLSKFVVDDILVLNFGEKARGMVYLKPAPLVDKKLDVFMAILNGVMADPGLARTMIRGINMESLTEHLDIGTEGDLNEEFKKLTLDEIAMGMGDGSTPATTSGTNGEGGGGTTVSAMTGSTIKTGNRGGQIGNVNGKGRRTVGKPAPPDAVTRMSRITRMLDGLDE